MAPPAGSWCPPHATPPDQKQMAHSGKGRTRSRTRHLPGGHRISFLRSASQLQAGLICVRVWLSAQCIHRRQIPRECSAVRSSNRRLCSCCSIMQMCYCSCTAERMITIVVVAHDPAQTPHILPHNVPHKPSLLMPGHSKLGLHMKDYG